MADRPQPLIIGIEGSLDGTTVADVVEGLRCADREQEVVVEFGARAKCQMTALALLADAIAGRRSGFRARPSPGTMSESFSHRPAHELLDASRGHDMPTTDPIDRLRAIVRGHRVYYQVHPEEWADERKRLKVGYELRLWGAHERGAGATPGCSKCRSIYSDLREVARWLVPVDERPSKHVIEVFDRALYASASLRDTDEVGLSLKILHRERDEAPVDECQERCLREMRQKLREIGAPEGRRSAG